MSTELIALSQESANASEFEGRVLELLRREVGFDVGFFSVKGDEARPTVVGLDQVTVELAVARGATYAEELLPVKHAALAARGVAVDTHVLGWERVRKLCYHREIAARVGGRCSLMAYLPWQGRIVAAVMLGRTGSTFSDRELRRVEGLLPALGVTRAAFGLPWVAAPLPAAVETAPRRWLGLTRKVRVLASVPTRAGALRVQDRGGFREMIASEGETELVWTRASVAKPDESGWPYVELLHLAATVARRRGRALFIGCGGAVAMRQFASVYPGIGMDVVEREPAVVELAREWYAVDSIPGLEVHVADGIDFVARAAPSSWDIVVVDAYDAGDLAAAFKQRSFFARLRRVLRPGGAVAFNLIGTLDGRGALPDVIRAARRELSRLRVVPVVAPDENYAPDASRNIVIIGTAP